ncbi:MAG: DUF362 domain-containing protein [Armatimonadetes bacterium]|nr:DUF362 domain-containing protein [Armatimonadota bacterium]
MAVYLDSVPDYNIDRIKECVQRGIDEVGVEINGARTAVLKINVVQARAPETGVVTHPAVVEATIDALRDRGVKEITIAEAPALGVDANKAFKETGIADLAKRKAVRLVNLYDSPYTKVHTGYGYKNLPNVYDEADLENYYCGYISLPSIMLESDLYVNIPKLKTHNRATVSISMKNQWGLLGFKDRQMYHRVGLHEPIVQIARAVRPHMTVVDGILALEGNGPILGKPKQFGAILVGKNMVETDIVGSELMQQDTRSVIHLQRAIELGLGSWETEVKGKRVEDLAASFEPAPQDVKKNHNFHLWRNHRACHLDDDAFQAAFALAKTHPKYWMFFPKLAYYTLFGRIDLVRGRGSKMPEFKKRQKIIVSGECARELIENYEEVPKNVIHIPGCPPQPEDIVKAIIRM